MVMRETVSPWIAAPVVAGSFVLLFWREIRRPLRLCRESKRKRDARNFVIGAVGAITIVAAESPIVQPLAQYVERNRFGLLGRVGLPFWLECIAALVLMDYTFYVWHVLLHRIPFLWRFHAVHHVDLDLDASTALRFHCGELLVSVPWRAAQVLAIGLTPFTFSLWQVAFALCVVFHHSNAEIPLAWERRINRILVTPRMHGIHHSVVPDETNSNWSSGLTIWDWLHRTLRLNVPQQEIRIGVPAFQEPSAVVLRKVLAEPFRAQPDYWQFPDGSRPMRHADVTPRDHLIG